MFLLCALAPFKRYMDDLILLEQINKVDMYHHYHVTDKSSDVLRT